MAANSGRVPATTKSEIASQLLRLGPYLKAGALSSYSSECVNTRAAHIQCCPRTTALPASGIFQPENPQPRVRRATCSRHVRNGIRHSLPSRQVLPSGFGTDWEGLMIQSDPRGSRRPATAWGAGGFHPGAWGRLASRCHFVNASHIVSMGIYQGGQRSEGFVGFFWLNWLEMDEKCLKTLLLWRSATSRKSISEVGSGQSQMGLPMIPDGFAHDPRWVCP